MSDERRAEIEVAARAISGFDSMIDSDAAAEAVIAALDRLRDARGDDGGASIRTMGDVERFAHAAEVNEHTVGCLCRRCEAARPPQGEDHELRKLIVDWTENGDPVLLDPSVGPPHPVVGTHDLPAPKADEKQEAR